MLVIVWEIIDEYRVMWCKWYEGLGTQCSCILIFVTRSMSEGQYFWDTLCALSTSYVFFGLHIAAMGTYAPTYSIHKLDL